MNTNDNHEELDNKPFKKWRIDDAAKLIEAELQHLFRNGGNADLSAILKKGDAWSKGLNNAETAMAAIAALAAVQQQMVTHLASLRYGPNDHSA
ncbi:hypothetical protein LUX29_21440 [Aureimonas altamirensis]|uniref:hypothetical protein n=1 Tax=Aureimonas altamirensis TaxID=370622 RepID=UPI001E4D5B7C|nr:hypothetical protein [Aureimonas altamirensis]UHD45519.1 hypothetical protein LUX29_21440 [Aureimonas altamirensis]